MTIPKAKLEALVRDVFGPTDADISLCVTAVNVYRTDPATTERLFKLLEEVGLCFPLKRAAIIATLLKQRMDKLEGVQV